MNLSLLLRRVGNHSGLTFLQKKCSIGGGRSDVGVNPVGPNECLQSLSPRSVVLEKA